MPKWLEQLGGESAVETIRRYMAPDDVVIKSGTPETKDEPEMDSDAAAEQDKPEPKADETPKQDAGDGEIDWDDWLNSQPKAVQQALSKREHGLKSALEKQTKAAREHEKELKRIATERQLAEDQKAKDEGRWKDLAEKHEKEAKELRARLEAEEWTKQTRQRLKDAELAEFEDILLASRETPDDVAQTGERIKALIDARVEKEVNRRLETGTRVKANGSVAPSKKPSEMTWEEKSAFVQEYGADEFKKAVFSEQGV